jgi:phosphatidylglycerophosphate synthase
MSEKIKESAFLALTAARLLQAPDYYKKAVSDKSVIGATMAILAIDMGDGILARRFGVEGPKRRLLDSAVDSTIIAAGLLSAYKMKPKTRLFAAALAAREVAVATGWTVDLLISKQAKKGDDYHRAASAAIAAFVLTANHGSEKVMNRVGYAAIAVNAALAYDYFMGWTNPERTTLLDNGVVEVAGFYDARQAAQNVRGSLTQLSSGSVNRILHKV